MYSVGNSYDYNNQSQSLTFIGTYENLSDYNYIFIYAKTIKNDTLYIQYRNDSNTDYEIEESYNINNTEKEITLTKKLKYFRIKITSTDQFSSSDQRLYSVYFFNGSFIVNSRLEDGSGNKLTSTSNRLDTNLADGSGNKLTSTSNRLNVNSQISDTSGNSIIVDASGNLKVNDASLITIENESRGFLSTIKDQANKLTFDASNNLYVNNVNKNTTTLTLANGVDVPATTPTVSYEFDLSSNKIRNIYARANWNNSTGSFVYMWLDGCHENPNDAITAYYIPILPWSTSISNGNGVLPNNTTAGNSGLFINASNFPYRYGRVRIQNTSSTFGLGLLKVYLTYET